MWNTFKYTILSLVKEKNILIWSLMFPLIMSTLFFVMFSDLDSSLDFKPIPAAVVDDGNYQDAGAFKAMIEGLSEPGEGQVFKMSPAASADEAKLLLEARDIVGYYEVDGEGDPHLVVTAPLDLNGLDSVNQTIMKDIADNYLRSSATVGTIAQENPAALADPGVIEALYSPDAFTTEVSVTANTASGSVRYFYALLGFAAIMAATIGMTAITRTQPNLSAVGARRAVGATSRMRTLFATLAASWLLSFACLVIAFCYMYFVLGIGFGGRVGACFLGLAVASLMSTGLGAFVGSIPKLGEGAKGGLLTGLTCLLALFAGLYGTASMQLADEMTRNFPLLQTINPSKQVADMFYSLYFYDGYDQFVQATFVLLAITVVLFLLAAIFMRRQRYAHI